MAKWYYPRNKMLRFLLIAFSAAVAGCSSTPPRDTSSIEGAQQVFFPDRYHYTVGDFVLSLPIGYYEFAMTRLAFADHILQRGMPRPVIEQKKYLVLPENALAPRRHFLLLDQRHLLIFSEFFALDNGYPASLEVLRRTSDAGWSDVTVETVPKWARSPKGVRFASDHNHVEVTDESGRSVRMFWMEKRFQPEN